MQTNSQKMAQAAYGRLSDSKVTKEFRSVSRGFPTMVHRSGLLQAISFAQSKGAGPHGEYLMVLVDVLKAVGFSGSADVKALHATILKMPSLEYMRISRAALEAAGWIKRYAEALAPGSAKAGETA